LDAAKAAGVAAKEFSELEKQTKRLKTQVGTALVGGGEGLSALANVAKTVADGFEVARKSAEELAAVDLRRTVGVETIIKGGLEIQLLSGTLLDMEGNIVRATDAMDLLGRAELETAGNAGVLTGAIDVFSGQLDEVTLRTELWEITQDRLNKELEQLRGLMTPLSGDIEDFQTTIKGLREEEEKLAAEFGLLEFLTPAQAEQIAQLKSDLTGVWILYQDIIAAIDEGNLGAGELESAEEAAEGLRMEMGVLEAQIRELGGIPYVTQEQEDDARERLGEIRSQIDSVTAAWTRQSAEMVFSLATQRLALGGFTDVELDALGVLAEGLDLIDPAQVAVLDAIAEASKKLAESGDELDFADDIEDIVDVLSDPDISAEELIEALDKIGEAGAEGGGLSTAVAQAEALQIKLMELDGTTVDVFVNIHETTTSEGGTEKEPEEGFQHGGSFKVGGAGGTDSTHVSFFATPGETVTVTPQGNTTNNTNTFGDVFPQSLDLGAMADAEEDEFFLG
ncbi:hypothetical protein LCGC14_2142370, partial [marine sediment metagenome]